jgi:CDP-diacylglycerol--glycerol-3-phosphate 3-phosphatidyltransferase
VTSSHGLVPEAVARGMRDGLAPLARSLAAAGIAPNAVTVSGVLITLAGAAVLVAAGPLPALVPLILGALADAVDGQLARLSGRVTAFGSFLDSTLDRVSDASVYAAAALIAVRTSDEPLALVALWAIVAAFLVSYARAKAESLGLQAGVGVAPREARSVLVLLGVALWGVTGERAVFALAIAITAILATITAAQRVRHVARQQR